MYQKNDPSLENQNLVDVLDKDYVNELGRQLKRRTDDEYSARSNFMEIIHSSLSALGLTQYQKGRGTDSGLESDIVDSTFLQTWIQIKNEFAAELLAPFKIAKTDIAHRNLLNASPNGNEMISQLDVYAQIVEEDINNKLNCEWSDWLFEIKKAIGAAFLTGSSISKVYMDPVINRPVLKMISPENILIGEHESSIEKARWIGHIYTLTEEELDIYQAKGVFAAVDIPPDNSYNEQNTISISELENRISGIDSAAKDNDTIKNYTFVEVQFWECAANNDDPAIFTGSEETDFTYYPYTAHIHKETGTVMAIDHAWDLVDGEIVKRQTMFKMTFLEANDFWGIGLAQTCIGLHKTATNILRNLTDSLAIANSQTLVMSQNLAPQQSTITLRNGEVNSIASPSADINDALMRLPFEQPSPMYMDFWGQLKESISKMAGLSSVTLQNLPPNMQGNFLLALMDKESKPMSVVLQNFQFAFNQMFKLLHKLLRTEWANKPIAPRVSPLTYGEVYHESINIISALDPSMSSSAAQLVRMQTLLDCALQSPQLHDLSAVYERLYKIMKIDNYKQLLLPPEVLQQQQEQAMQAQQQELAAQQQQQQEQNQILMADIENKKMANEQEINLKFEKLMSDNELNRLKIILEKEKSLNNFRLQLLKEKGAVVKQKNVEIAQLDKAKREYLVDSAEMKAAHGISLPNIPEPKLENYDIEDMPLHVDDNNTVSGEPKLG